jgi:hypothetical protein
VEEQHRQELRVNERKAQFRDKVAATEKAHREQDEDAKDQLRAQQKIDAQNSLTSRDRRQLEAAHEANKPENAEKLSHFAQTVANLNVGAWLLLPSTENTCEKCKLAVRITRADKLIFVTRTGIKIDEYNSEELTQLLVAGQAEIQDQGIEFEDTLAQVVSRLRHDRNKSYDDLTKK